jgi:uncharacterized membrane protein YqgA involved in biofilm formation
MKLYLIILGLVPPALLGILLAEARIKIFNPTGLLVLVLAIWIGAVLGVVFDIYHEVQEIDRLLEATAKDG